ncbi:MAG: hypothetical protein H6581_14915 [Bacteroidia bacterium]|nr:hypothetical protein [Bacteroidia bacterium]
MNGIQLEQAYKTEKYTKLALALVIDAVGMVSYFIPGIAETIDIVWAPIAAAANFMLFKGATGVAGATFTLTEELLPGTDFIPSVTLTWASKYIARDHKTFEAFAEKRMKKQKVLNRYDAELETGMTI